MRSNKRFPRILVVAAIAALALAALVEMPAAHGLGPFTSQGVTAHSAIPWHQEGFNGQGVKVGLIDLGFQGVTSLLGNELPTMVAVRCYTSIGRFTRNIADCENGGDHGTVSAESVMDMAPGASLYLANPTTYADIHDAVDWMVGQGVSVIYYPFIDPFEGPGDGKTPFTFGILNAVDSAVDGGAVWVNPAGNYGRRSWFGEPRWSPNGFHQFQGADVFNTTNLLAGDEIVLELRWEDSWGRARWDLDLIVWDEAAREIVGISGDPQLGARGHIPHEILSFQAPRDGQYSVVVGDLLDNAAPRPGWIQLLARGDVFSIEYHTQNYSIGNPADSANPGLLAVGAAHWSDTHIIEPYSSRGPTPDQRIKPDVVGVDCGVTSRTPLDLFGDGFCGTSQSAAHVAGIAALVRQRFPGFSPQQVTGYLTYHAVQQSIPDPNNVWGYGFAELPSVDRAVLEVLYNATGGDNWLETTNWMTSGALSTWHGVTTDSQGRVTVLDLTRNQLEGELPPELADLTNLKVLALGGNQLTGKIPAWLGHVTNLLELYLWGNELNGEIPNELGSLTNLTTLSLSDNQLTGTVPAWLGNLTSLEGLYLTQTQLTGTVPAELGSLNDLTILALGGNQLTGTVPAWLDSLTNLQKLYLWGNELNGEIPTELGSLTNLEMLSISANQLTGEIPAELGNLTNLMTLGFSDNQLTGTIPAWLGSLSNLKELYLWGNELNGEIPAELGGLTNLEVLSLYSNELNGEIPAELGGLTNLEVLSLYRNELNGEIPAELGGLTNLEVLSLYRNELTGEIPAELGGLTNLEVLSLYRNELTGEIPAEFGSLTSLEVLSLTSNELTGEIPVELGSLTNLEVLQLFGNELAGEIPAELGRPTNLSRLELSNNQLTGEIPAELGGLTNLEVLSLSSNQFTGTVPAWLGNLINLTTLNLSANRLTGEIPAELGRLDKLEELHLSENQLTGCIPATLRDVLTNDLAELALPVCASSLVARYDANNNGTIEKSEVITAINDYLFGQGDEPIRKADVIELINLYLFG